MSAFSPLKQRTFAALWLAAVVSNIGTWMHEVGAGWLMTELTSDPLMISLVAASTSLPVFLFVIPGVVAYGLSFYFMALTLKVMPVGIVYAIWSGLGIVLIAAMIERSIADGLVRFDFLKGDERYKYHLGAVERPLSVLEGTFA